MKNILHHRIVLHPKAQGKQQLCLPVPPPKGAKKGRLFNRGAIRKHEKTQ